jgi:hypothetical protein
MEAKEAYGIVNNYINYLEGRMYDTTLLNLATISEARRMLHLYFIQKEIDSKWAENANLGKLPGKEKSNVKI